MVSASVLEPRSVHITTERSLVWVFTILAKVRRANDSAATVRIPDTVYYQHGSLRAWYANEGVTDGREIVKRDKRDCTNDRIMDILGAAAPPGAVSDGIAQDSAKALRRWKRATEDEDGPLPKAPPGLPVAVYRVYEAPSGSPTSNAPGGSRLGASAIPVASGAAKHSSSFVDETGEALDVLTEHFMDRAGLYQFLENSRAAKHNAVLQRFPHGRNPQHSTITVVWSPHQTICTQRQNLAVMTDVSVPLFDRCCTSEASSHLSREIKMTPHAVKALTSECDGIVKHIAAVESRHVVRMCCEFAFDNQRRAMLLGCSEVQLTSAPMPMADVAAGLSRTFTRKLVHIAPPVRNGASAIVAAGGGLTMEDVAGASKTRAGSRIKLTRTANRPLDQCIDETTAADPFNRQYGTMSSAGGRRTATPSRERNASATRRARSMTPQLAFDCPALRPDVEDDHTVRYAGDDVGAYLSRARATPSSLAGRSSVVPSPQLLAIRGTVPRPGSGQRVPHAAPKSNSLGLRFSGGGGGGFFVDRQARRELQQKQREARAVEEREAAERMLALRASNQTPDGLTIEDSDDDEDRPDAPGAVSEARRDVIRMYGHAPAATAAARYTELRDRAWRRLKRRMPPTTAVAVDSALQSFARFEEALDDVAAEFDLTAAVAPRHTAEGETLSVPMPETLSAFVAGIRSECDGLLGLVALTTILGEPLAMVLEHATVAAAEQQQELDASMLGLNPEAPSQLEGDRPVAAGGDASATDMPPFAMFDASAESAPCPAAVTGEHVRASVLDGAVVGLQQIAARQMAASNGASSVPAADLFVDAPPNSGGGLGSKILLSPAGRKAGAALEHLVPQQFRKFCPDNLIPVTDGGWRALRDRLTAIRAAGSTAHAARLYFILALVNNQRAASFGTSGIAASLSATQDLANPTSLDQCMADLVSAEVAVAGTTAEWPPRWAIQVTV